MQTPGPKAVLLIAACGWGLWLMADRWLGPAVEPGKVAVLTPDNFGEARRAAGTLIAFYMRPG